jgi:hypothetical protein
MIKLLTFKQQTASDCGNEEIDRFENMLQALITKSIPAHDILTLHFCTLRAYRMFYLQRFENAESISRQMLQIRLNTSGPSHVETIFNLSELGSIMAYRLSLINGNSRAYHPEFWSGVGVQLVWTALQIHNNYRDVMKQIGPELAHRAVFAMRLLGYVEDAMILVKNQVEQARRVFGGK